jgi:hypothetical protein
MSVSDERLAHLRENPEHINPRYELPAIIDLARRALHQEGVVEKAMACVEAHAHHALWGDLLGYKWSDETEAFVGKLTNRIAAALASTIEVSNVVGAQDDGDMEMSGEEKAAYQAAKQAYETSDESGVDWLKLPRLTRLGLYRAARSALAPEPS